MEELDPSQAQRTTQALWTTLLASQVAYVVILLSGAANVSDQPPNLAMFPVALAALALATAAGARFFWRRATQAGALLHASAPEPSVVFTSYVTAWVLDESIAVYGLMLGLLAFGPGTWVPFSAAAFVLMLLHRPA